MNLQPLLQASPAVQVHVATVLPAFVLGLWLLFASRKGSPAHRLAGRVYLTLMVVTAFTAIFIASSFPFSVPVGPFRFSPIHLFVVLTLTGCWRAWTAVKRGDLVTHQKAVRGTFFGALVIAGAFTLLPGRIMHALLFT